MYQLSPPHRKERWLRTGQLPHRDSWKGGSATTYPEPFPASPTSDITLSIWEPQLLGQLSGCSNPRETGVSLLFLSPLPGPPNPQTEGGPALESGTRTELLAPPTTQPQHMNVLEAWAPSSPRASPAELCSTVHTHTPAPP